MNDTPINSDTPSTAELDALRAVVEGTAGHTGDEFFRSLVRHLSAAVGTRYAFVAVFAGGTMARTLAFWLRDRIGENIEWDVVRLSFSARRWCWLQDYQGQSLPQKASSWRCPKIVCCAFFLRTMLSTQ